MSLGKNVFTFGQAYTALSRVPSINDLSLIQFHPDSIKCHPKVSEFYQTYSPKPILKRGHEPSQNEKQAVKRMKIPIAE